MIVNLDKAKPVFIDTETNYLYHNIRLFQVMQEHWDAPQIFDIRDSDLIELLGELKDCTAVIHNATYDIATILNDYSDITGKEMGRLPFKDVEDTLLLAKLVWAHTLESFSLDSCFEYLLGEDVYSKILDDDGKPLDKKKMAKSFLSLKTRDMGKLDISTQQLQYAATDVFYLPQLYYKLKELMTEELNDLYKVDSEFIKNSLLWERNGLPIIESKVKEVEAECNERLSEIEQSNILQGINFNSPKQVTEFLGITQSDSKTLLAMDDPRSSAILEARKLTKTLNFLDRYRFERVRGHFSPTTKSGRVRCDGSDKAGENEDNLLQIPRSLKKVIGYPEDSQKYLIYCDYSNLELRTACVLTQEEVLYNAFVDGVDLHTRTAEIMFNIPYDSVDKQQRTAAKMCNFSQLYCGSASSLKGAFLNNAGINITDAESTRYHKLWLNTYKNIKVWHDSARRTYMKGQMDATTLNGRPYKAKLFTDICGVNNQSIGADVAKRGLNKFIEMSRNSKVLCFIHDAIIAECDSFEIAKQEAELLGKCMLWGWHAVMQMNTSKFNMLPMPLDVGVAHNLLDCDKDENFVFSIEGTFEQYNQICEEFKIESKILDDGRIDADINNTCDGPNADDINVDRDIHTNTEEVKDEQPVTKNLGSLNIVTPLFAEEQITKIDPTELTKDKHLVVDADTLVYVCASELNDEPFEYARDVLLSRIQAFKETTKYKSAEFHLTSQSYSFRYQIFNGYKKKRVSVARPVHLASLKKWLADSFTNVYSHIYWEADDAVYTGKFKNPDAIVCSIDKDVLKGIAGKHYNYVKNEIVETSESFAKYFPYYQTLIGDSSDSILGIPGFGPKSAEKLISESMSEKDMWGLVAEMYKTKGLSVKDAILNMRLVRLDQCINGQVELWHPSDLGLA